MKDVISSDDRAAETTEERIKALEQRVELLLCLQCGIVADANRGGLTDEQWTRFVEIGKLARGYFGHSYIATGEGDFSTLQIGLETSYRVHSLLQDPTLKQRNGQLQRAT
jgi:hypothetical protein